MKSAARRVCLRDGGEVASRIRQWNTEHASPAKVLSRLGDYVEVKVKAEVEGVVM